MIQVLLKSAVAFCSFVLSLLLTGLQAAPGLDDTLDKNHVDINIGIYAPFSNKHAFIGRNMLGAMEMARDQLKPSNVHYSFYTLDKLPDNRNPVSTLQKFIKAHQIKVLLTQDLVKPSLADTYLTKTTLKIQLLKSLILKLQT